MKSRLVSALVTSAVFAIACSAFAANKGGDKDNKGLSRQDRHFIDTAMKDNNAEVALAKVAQENASSDAVKQFAQKLSDDHTKAGSELQSITSKLGYTPPEKVNKQPGDVKKFSKMKGDKFDRAFAKQMVKDHEKTIKLFKKEAQDGQAQEVWQFANDTLPKLEQHLQMARDLAGDKTSKRKRKEG